MALRFSAIACKSINDVIGNKQWIPESKVDKLHFKRVTEYSPDNRKNLLICGRVTCQDMPKITNNRRDLVILSTSLKGENIFSSIESLYNYCLEKRSQYYKFFVIGGEKVYTQFLRLNLIDKLYLTQLSVQLEGDLLLKLSLERFELKSESQQCDDVSFVQDKYLATLKFQNYKLRSQFEHEYLDLVNKVLINGIDKETRNGRVRSLNDLSFKVDLRDGFPILTTRKIFFRGIVGELLWILSGSTDTSLLKEQGINIWNYHSSRTYLDSVGLRDLPEGQIGPGYGHQMRNFNGTDQLRYVIDLINNEPQSRRIFISLWNPPEINRTALPPCHVSYHFTVQENRLNCHLYQRSWDILVGWNTTTAALFTHILAHHCNLEPGTVTHSIGDIHIYHNNIDKAKELVKKIPYQLPTLSIFNKRKSIDEYAIEDFKLNNYKHHESMSMELN